MIPAMFALGLLLLTSFTSVAGDGVRLDFDEHMRSRVVASLDGELTLGPYTYSEALQTAAGELRDFSLQSREETEISDALGQGHAVVLSGRSGSVVKRVFAALAAEAALKLLELTDGAVVAVANTPLGFRHGPKTIVNRATLVILFVANDPLARKYDLDLLEELRSDAAAGGLLAIAAAPPPTTAAFEWLPVPDRAAAEDAELLLPCVVAAQMYALHRSLQLGNTPDTPCASGRVDRIVKGVAIYPL